MDKERLEEMKRNFEEERHTHKLTHSNFDIITPKTTKNEVYNNSILFEDSIKECLEFVWCEFNGSNVPRKSFDQLRLNFQKDSCDLIGEEKVSTTKLMLATTEMNPEMKKSDRWRWIGAVSIEKGIISWAWIHPYFRRQKLFLALIIRWYIPKYGRLQIQPPISNAMQGFIKYISNYIEKTPEIMEGVFKKYRKYLLEIGANPEKINSLSNDYIGKIMIFEKNINAFVMGSKDSSDKVTEVLIQFAENFDSIAQSLDGAFSESEMQEGKDFIDEVNRQVETYGKFKMSNKS